MNIKRCFLILLLAVVMVGCVPLVFVRFEDTDLSAPCRLRIDTDNNQPIFHNRPGGNVISVIEALDLPRNLDDEEDYIIVNGSFGVSSYAVADDGLWFPVTVSVLRRVEGQIVDPSYFEETSTPRFGFPVEVTYEEEGLISTGTFWIPESAVASLSNIEDMNCVPTVVDGETVPGVLQQVYYCSATQPATDTVEVGFRVGPGSQRSVRYVAVEPFEFEIYGYTMVGDVRWLQVSTSDYGLLWVNESDVETEGNCMFIPEIPAPPLVARPETLEVGSGSCEAFEIISPIGQVAEENAIYSWTPVDGADEYVLTFFNYLSAVSDVIPVDGSQTSVEIYTGSLQTGSQLSFSVTAKRAGEVLCSTPLSGWIERLAAQSVPEPEPSATPVEDDDDDNNRRRNNGGGGYTPPEGYTPPGE